MTVKILFLLTVLLAGCAPPVVAVIEGAVVQEVETEVTEHLIPELKEIVKEEINNHTTTTEDD